MRLFGLLQAFDQKGRPKKPVTRQGASRLVSSVMTRLASIDVELEPNGDFVVRARTRRGRPLLLAEGNIHAVLDEAGLFEQS